MYCTLCGEKIETDSLFCKHCGQVVKNSKFIKLQKIYATTGNFSILFSIIGFVMGMVIGYNPKNIATDAAVALLWNFPRFYFGLGLKKRGSADLIYALKVSKGMLIYSIVVLVTNLVIDGSGFLYSILIYFYYKSYKETKRYLRTLD